MAFFTPQKRRSRRALMSDMNVTPMIDVMLVLLIIFMVTAPMLTVGVNVNLPSATAPNVTQSETPMIVQINHEGQIYIGNDEVDLDTLPDKLDAVAGGKDVRIFVRGDKHLSYGTIMSVMGCINEAGFKKVILVTELPKKRIDNEKR